MFTACITHGTGEEGEGDRRFQKGKVKVACLYRDETEREWRGIMVWSKWCHSAVQEMGRARKGVAILLNDMWYSMVIDFGCVSSRIL